MLFFRIYLFEKTYIKIILNIKITVLIICPTFEYKHAAKVVNIIYIVLYVEIHNDFDVRYLTKHLFTFLL